MKVLVIGAGFAGIAAACAARAAGAEVCVVHAGAGASALYAGVIDGDLLPSHREDPLLLRLVDSLGLRLAHETLVCTREGMIRNAEGADAALLNVSQLAGKNIAVVDVERDDWDAPLLVQAFAANEWARRSRTRFERVRLELLEKSHHRRTSPYDFAASFERAERPGWLAQTLKAHAGPDAWLFGPWLGLRRPLAAELSAAAGVPVGEVTSAPGGVSGARFEARRDSLLDTIGLQVVRGVVQSVATDSENVTLGLSDGSILRGTSLVLACGGVVSGAVQLRGALSGAERAGFELSIAGLPAVEMNGELTGPVSSLFGVDLAARGRRLLERVGLPSSAGAVVGTSRVFAAGDVLAPPRPTVAHAFVSGLMAGAAAASAN